MKIIKSASMDTIDAVSIDVESTFTRGLPSFTIVGMISTSISESRDRVKSALLVNDFKFPPLIPISFKYILNTISFKILTI
ncbi:magnesium chelatase domain-containing protein [Aliarcobacter butzleri]|uniref:magnesium chelatase domain-containing protein n=1 Tax=Aliarcobacter butzleri TaxID=28197 RepID=UPI0002295962|nr:magnesium chelatase domain-containing protein [Aliarcobacter butzleri]BAK71267.1 conserved hypothetical protein [Aliarcobacter butzleri ED-1]